MRPTLAAALAVVFFTLCEAIPTPEPTYTLHEKRSGSPRLWARGERVSRNAILPVRIGLAQNNLEDGHIHLMDV
jgi:tripeptidyl-peptidase-1